MKEVNEVTRYEVAYFGQLNTRRGDTNGDYDFIKDVQYRNFYSFEELKAGLRELEKEAKSKEGVIWYCKNHDIQPRANETIVVIHHVKTSTLMPEYKDVKWDFEL